MIKRTLGVWNDADEDDEGLTTKQRSKLERRLLPGVSVGRKENFKAGFMGEESEPESSDDGEDPEGAESEDDPAMPQEAERDEQKMRGQFQCKLCPGKILMNEKIMEQHLQSEAHLKNARRFERASKMGLEAFEDECRERAEAREAADGKASKRQLKKTQHWEKVRAKVSEKKGGDTKKEQNLTADQIEARRERFQKKKARRLERKGITPTEKVAEKTIAEMCCARQGGGVPKGGPKAATKPAADGAGKAAPGGGKKVNATPDPSGLNRKQRRALAAEEAASAAAAKGSLPTVTKPAAGSKAMVKARQAEEAEAEGRGKRRKKAAA
mmetsp:Transcript_68134/g.200062  ORF Transcript_68134/g.200062 Transcript_68134/m.200062 type:complete len:326 (-) Transcript_68134:37-1014(-)